MNKILKTLLITGPLITGVFLWSSLNVAHAEMVNCDKANAKVQTAVDNADGPTTINIKGTCVENVTIEKDDITLSGKQGMSPCDKADPGGNETIEGTITVKSARARIEFLTITGDGGGVIITDRAAVELDCNDIVDNQETGISVRKSSHALLTNNKVRGNGERTTLPFPFFDCGLFVAGASAVTSLGNTYEDNQYCAIEVDRQSAFRSGRFLPSGFPADLTETDIIVERGCDIDTGGSCLTDDDSRVAIEMFNGGLVDLRNARVGGEILTTAQSSFRVDGNAEVKGNILVEFNSIVRIRSREQEDHTVTYTGTLTCETGSLDWFSSVECGQTCTGAIPGSCLSLLPP